MTNENKILSILNNHYPMHFDLVEFIRDSGSIVYSAYADGHKYFLRITKPAFFDTAVNSVDIQVFLLKQGFSVPPIIFTKNNSPCIHLDEENGKHLYILYEFIEGSEADPEQDAEAIGALVGKLHFAMKSYPKSLVKRDRHFYIGRYLDILRKKQYPRSDEFAAYGEALWERIKNLPQGYCHGDMYRGNFHKTPNGQIYLLDYDTSCLGFPMYDPVLICNMSDYFQFEEDGYSKSQKVFERFLPEYLKYNDLTQTEINAFNDLIALYHFTLQATIIELFGLDCVNDRFFDSQLDWLIRWREQCTQYKDILALSTTDLLLKTVTVYDIDEVARMWKYPNDSIPLEEARNAILYMLSNHKKNRPGYIYHLCFSVREKTNKDKIIGWCGLDGKIQPGQTVLFYSIAQPYRNKGYATQCANRLLKYAFESAQLDCVNGGCHKSNIPSYKVMKKVGMTQETFCKNGDPLFFINKDTYFQKETNLYNTNIIGNEN